MIVANEEQPRKTHSLIRLTFLGRFIDVNRIQPTQARLCISRTEKGMRRSVKEVQPSKEPRGIVDKLFGGLADLSLPTTCKRKIHQVSQ